jgi:hypothetical protein
MARVYGRGDLSIQLIASRMLRREGESLRSQYAIQGDTTNDLTFSN